MTIEASLTCDGCAHIILSASSAGIARREFREQGGKTAPWGDFCAQCVEKSRHVEMKGRERTDGW